MAIVRAKPPKKATKQKLTTRTDNAFFEYMKSLSPSAVDLEIRSLLALPHLNLFLHGLTRRLRSHRDFEAVQAYMSVFLSVHGDVLVGNDELKEGFKRAQKEEGKRVGELVRYALGTLNFLRTAGL
jgi:U3 small nucleolar RNA-associated protein 21